MARNRRLRRPARRHGGAVALSDRAAARRRPAGRCPRRLARRRNRPERRTAEPLAGESETAGAGGGGARFCVPEAAGGGPQRRGRGRLSADRPRRLRRDAEIPAARSGKTGAAQRVRASAEDPPPVPTARRDARTGGAGAGRTRIRRLEAAPRPGSADAEPDHPRRRVLLRRRGGAADRPAGLVGAVRRPEIAFGAGLQPFQQHPDRPGGHARAGQGAARRGPPHRPRAAGGGEVQSGLRLPDLAASAAAGLEGEASRNGAVSLRRLDRQFALPHRHPHNDRRDVEEPAAGGAQQSEPDRAGSGQRVVVFRRRA